MQTYLSLLSHILKHGTNKVDRTGVGVYSCFGYQMRFDLAEGFPLVTTKKMHTKSIIYELLWFLKGHTNIAFLKENGISIWDEWANAAGELGPIYGKQWRSWECKNNMAIDQISNVIEEIKKNPHSRRLVVSAWNVADLPAMALQPCHVLFQFYVSNKKLSCHLYQRSADAFLGIPFNIASYALLTMMIAQVCDLQYGEFIHSLGDAHIYLNHIDQVRLQLSRSPFPLPTIQITTDKKNIFDFQYNDFTLFNYQYHPSIKAPIAI